MFFNQVQDTDTGMGTGMDTAMGMGMDTDMDMAIHGVLMALDLVSKGSINGNQRKELEIHDCIPVHVKQGLSVLVMRNFILITT